MDFLKEQLKKLPGLSYVFGVASLLLLRSEPKFLQVCLIALLAWFFHWMGSALKWDDLFDHFYRPGQHRERDKEPFESRREAASKLRCPITGIYRKAKLLFANTESWEKQIKWVLELSKAARTLLLPCLLILFYRTHQVTLAQLYLLLAAYFVLAVVTGRPGWSLVSLSAIVLLHLSLRHFVPQMPWYSHIQEIRQGIIKQWEMFQSSPAFSYLSAFWAHNEIKPETSRIEWLAQNSWAVALIFLVAFFLYFWLRLVHLRRLYALVQKARVYEFDVSDRDDKKRSLLAVNRSLLPRKRVLLVGPPQDRCKPASALYLAGQFLQAACGIDVVVYILHGGESVAVHKFRADELSRFEYRPSKQPWLSVLRERLQDFSEAGQRDKVPILPDNYSIRTLPDTAVQQYHWDRVIAIDYDLPGDLKSLFSDKDIRNWKATAAKDRRKVPLERMAKAAAKELSE